MTTPQDFQPILERLLCSLVDKQREVEVRYRKRPGGVSFEFTCAASECGMIVGAKGVRLRALRLIVEVAGRNLMEDWRLEQPGELPGERLIGRRPAAEIPEYHNPSSDFELLRDLLQALGVNVTMAVEGDVNSGFRFALMPVSIQDNTALLEPQEAVYSSTQQDRAPLNLVAAIGCVLRASASRQGVIYRFQVE